MPGHLFLQLFPLSLISFIHLVTSAATNRLLVSHEDSKYGPEFDASRYRSISDWFAAQGRVLESANNATKECLSNFTVGEDNSVCYGDDEWKWNAVAIICVATVVAGLLVLLWLCFDWAQTCMLWYLDDTGANGRSYGNHDTSNGKVRCVNAKKSHQRVDSVLSQSTVEVVHPKAKDVEQRANSIQSETTADGLLSLPVVSGDGFGSDTPAFQELDSTLRNLGWLP